MEKIAVDFEKLLDSAERVNSASNYVELGAAHSFAGAAVGVANDLPGSVAAGAVTDVSRQVQEVAADLCLAMDGVRRGLVQAAQNFREVDVVYGRAAEGR